LIATHFQTLKWALIPGTVPKHKATLKENTAYLCILIICFIFYGYFVEKQNNMYIN